MLSYSIAQMKTSTQVSKKFPLVVLNEFLVVVNVSRVCEIVHKIKSCMCVIKMLYTLIILAQITSCGLLRHTVCG